MKVIEVDKRNFDTDGINLDTGEKYDANGYDVLGFDRNGIHKDTGTKYNRYGYDITGFNAEGFNVKGYDREGYDREGYDVNKIDRHGISKKSGEKDTKITIAEKFIESGLTLKEFSEMIEVDPAKVNRLMQTIRRSPYIKDALDEALQKNDVVFSKESMELKQQLLTGQKSIKEVGSIDDIIAVCTESEKQEVREILIKAMNTHEIRILEYQKIFNLDEEKGNLPSQILKRLSPMLTTAKRSKKPEIRSASRGIYKEIDRISRYQSPYNDNDLTKVGYVDENNQSHWLTISKERIEMAKKYLKATGEYICYKTMDDVFMGVLKGTLDEHHLQTVVEQKTGERDKGEEPAE